MKPISEVIKNKPWLGWLLFLETAIIVFLVGLFASSIIE
jgi:nitrite reductase (cytochrome c-552)